LFPDKSANEIEVMYSKLAVIHKKVIHSGRIEIINGKFLIQ